MKSLINLKERLHNYEAEKNFHKNKGIETQKKLKEAKQKKKALEQASKFLQSIAKLTQQTVEEKLASIVTSALQTIFPEDNYEFKIKFVEKRNTTECQLLFIKDGEEYRPLEDDAGGPIDIASLALLVAFIKLENKHPLILTDEPFKFVDRKKIKQATLLFKNICEKMDFQIIAVTHLSELIKQANKNFCIKKGEVVGN